MDTEFIQRLLDPRYLLELAERSPDASISLSRLLREWGGGQMAQEMDPKLVQYFVSNFLKRAIETPYLFELLERSPEAALEVVRVVSALGARELRQGLLHPKFLERLFDGRFFMRLVSRSPEAVPAIVQMVRELGIEDERVWRSVDPKLSQSILDPHYLLELSCHSPESALALEQLGRDLGAEADDRKHKRRLPLRFDSADSAVSDWLSRPVRDPRGLAVALRLAPRIGSKKTLRALAEAIAKEAQTTSLDRMLPLSVLGDLHWIANSQDDPGLREPILQAIPRIPADDE